MSWPSRLIACVYVTCAACTGSIGETARDEGPSDESGHDHEGGAGGAFDEAPELPLAKPRMSRLTRDEYNNTLVDVFGAAVVAPARALDRDHVTAGSLSLGAREVAVSRAAVGRYGDNAAALAQALVKDPNWRHTWIPCLPTAVSDADCATEVVQNLGSRLFRRPLAASESERYSRVVTAVAEDAGDFIVGVEAALTALLLSPNFTHRIEDTEEHAGGWRHTAWSLASRLSYWLWDGPPDAELLRAADEGRLHEVNGLKVQVDRMLLEEAKLARGLRSLADDLFELHKIEVVSKDANVFPMDNPALREAMREGALQMAAFVWADAARPLLDVYQSSVWFINEAVAKLNGLAAPTQGFERKQLASDELRVGLLTEPAVLAAHAGASLTSPTFRGLFVRRQLLCMDVPSPPPGIDNMLPAKVQGTTRREQIESHMENPTCVTCHRTMDPIGFGLEGFDALGREQREDAGAAVFAEGDLDGVTFRDARGLSQAVRDHVFAAPCLAQKILAHATGAAPQVEEDGVGALQTVMGGEAASMKELLRAVALAPSFVTSLAPE